jgi:hypothetical protein
MSSEKCTAVYSGREASYTLVPVTRNKRKLVVELEPDDYVKFAAAVALFRKRSMAAYVHDYAIDTINLAQEKFSPEQFQAAYDKKLVSVEARSKAKSRERKRGTNGNGAEVAKPERGKGIIKTRAALSPEEAAQGKQGQKQNQQASKKRTKHG